MYHRANMRDRDPGIEVAIMAAGGVRRLARMLALSHATVSKWEQVPERHVGRLERILKIPGRELRPDLFQR